MTQTRRPVVRKAVPEDAARLAVLATQVWLHTYATEGVSADIADYVLAHITPELQLAAIQDPATQVWVAEQGAHLVGMAVSKVGEPCADDPGASVELQTLYVQEHFLRFGVGRQLLDAAQVHAWQGADSPLWLTVNAQNANAIAFYARMGYRQVGTAYFTVGQGRHENHVLVGPRADFQKPGG